MKILIFFLLTCSGLYSQDICNVKNQRKSKSNDNGSFEYLKCLAIKDYNYYLNNSTERDILNKIAKVVYLSNNFKYVNCDKIYNACAVINPIDNKRYILFDKNFFDLISNENYWYKVFILSHEIAHHLNGHTVEKSSVENYLKSQNNELQCDFFAGFVLYKLGASEEDLKRAIDLLPEAENDFQSHPRNKKRFESAIKGFKKEFNLEINKYNEYKDQLVKQFVEYSIDLNCQNLINSIEFNVNEFIYSSNTGYLNVAYSNLVNLKNCKVDLSFYKYIIYKHLNIKNELLELLKDDFNKNPNDNFTIVRYIDALEQFEEKDEKLLNVLITRFPTNEPKSEYVNNQIGIFFANQHSDFFDSLAYKCFKTAYDSIKNKESDNLLKSDIFIAYAKAIYSRELKLNSKNLSFSKNLFVKGIDILKKLPSSYENDFYKPTALFHLGTIDKIQESFFSSEIYYKEFLSLKYNYRKDLICKTYFQLYTLYENQDQKLKALEYLTKHIDCSDIESKSLLLVERSKLYINLNDYELALEDLNESCNLGDKNSCKVLEDVKKIKSNYIKVK
jgi:hypothetical protein